MFEPDTPVTIYMTSPFPRPAVQLESDEWTLLPPNAVIMRYRHLVQQRILRQ